METYSLPSIHSVLEYWAEKTPDLPFLVTGDGQCSMAHLDKQSTKLANSLQALGVSSGDMVAVMMEGSANYLKVWFALSKIGAVEVPINNAYKGLLLEHVIETTELTTVILDAEFCDVVGNAFASLGRSCKLIKNKINGETSLANLIEQGRSDKINTDVLATDTACVLFTSGTTGPSKGVLMSHGHQLSFGKFFNEIVGMSEDDVTYNYLPFFHIAAKFLTLGTLLAGAQMALMPVFRLTKFWNDVNRFGATVCIAVGGLCHMLRGLPQKPEDSQNTLRLIYAVPRPSEFLNDFQTRFGLTVAEGYGSTETNLVVYSNGNDAPEGSCGRASKYFDVRIMNELGEEVETGISGEICVRPNYPNTIMKGYVKMPHETLDTCRGLWLHTGDRGYVDRNGYFFFQDRMKDAMRRRGENISSFEVERMINEHPDIAESAVVAVSSDLDEDDVLAVVVPRQEKQLNPRELIYYFSENMPYFMVPRYLRFSASLPRTPTQKVRKIELREEGITQDTWDSVGAGLRVTRHGILAENEHG